VKALALALAIALAAPAAAQDVPLLTPVVPAVGGTLTPASALCLDPAEQLTLAKRLEADRAAIESLKAAPQGLPVAVVVLIAVGAVLAGGAAGYGIAAATAPK
jgi:hypothetical protein